MSTGRKLVSDNIENKYYLYRHVRLDKSIPFYIGIGTKPKKFINYSVEFLRAYNKSRRNNIWKKIINKTKYRVDILFESNNYECIKEKEREFVSLYGRINIKNGTLANLTDGGEGNTGYIASDETRKKIGDNNYSKGKFGKDNIHSKKVYQYSLDGDFIKEWISCTEVKRSSEFKKTVPHLKQKSYCGFMWRSEYLGEKINPIDYSKGIENRVKIVQKPVYQYDLNGIFLKKFESITRAIKEIKGSYTGLGSSLDRKNHRYLDYLWYREYLGKQIVVNVKQIPKIEQYDLEDNLLYIYDKPSDIIKKYNSGRHTYRDVKNVCLGITKTCLHFKWKYNYDTTQSR